MKISTIIIMIFCNVLIYGQTTEGIIKYKQTSYFEFENMPADMPKSQETYMRLFFNKSESLYEKDPEVIVVENSNDNTPRMFRRMRDRSARIYYKNFAESSVLEQLGFFGKDFLVSDSIASIKWKISAGDQKTILGYTCMKASYKDSTLNIVAFFSPQIPVSTGPDKYGKLPGLILEFQSAQTHIIATEVSLKALDKPIEKPSKGDVFTKKEFEKLRAEKMKEQGEMGGRRDGNVRIMRQ
ncbi:MAG: GLPGLI family protein [Saprospiraceae bacterium]|nr:GLPGLI family protein [Saprospiraceae bacterium]